MFKSLIILLIGLSTLTGCIRGPMGGTGKQGVAGPAGLNGLDGLNGTNGADGSSCSVLPADDGSGALIVCTNGTSAFIKNGVDGLDGQSAVSVSMVKLCPQINGSYPNDFPEYAFKLDGLLYATMSTHSDAWTTQLSPRTYTTTTTTGVNCTFTVNTDGTVTN